MRAACVPAALGLLAALAMPGAAQDPDSVPPAPRPAPVTYTPPRVAFSVAVGTLGFGELQRQRVTAELLDDAGAVTATDTLTRTLDAGGGFQVGASALLGLTPAWAVRAGLSWGRASLDAGYAGDDELARDAAGIPATASDRITVLAGEAALRFRFRSARRLQPYAELGAGAARVEAADPAFPGAGSLAGETSLTAVAALGAVIPLWDAVTGTIQATGLFFRTPADPAPGGVFVGAADTLRLAFQAPAAGPFADPTRELTRMLRLDVGLSIELGAAARSPGAAAAPPSAARRSPRW